MRSVRWLLGLSLTFVVLLFLVGCKSLVNSLVGGQTLTISVSASKTTLQAGDSTGVSANVSHSGGNPAVTWSMSGSSCGNNCGSLSTVNGETYTAPDFAPATFMVTVTATAVADTSKTASVVLTVNHSLSVSCPSGHEAGLSGQYAFVLRGGGSSGGVVTAGSITADGQGNITAGLEDINSNSAGPQTGLTIPSGQSLYTVGADDRGCLGLANSQNTINLYRFGLATFSSGIAASGRIIEFDDTTGNGTRAEGFLASQDTTSFGTGSLQGNYVFVLGGGDGSGGRYGSVGVCAASAGLFSNCNMDSNDAGVLGTNVTGLTGSYSVSSTGRGTMNLSTSSGQNFALYMVSGSRFVAMATDPLDPSHPLQSGQFFLQASGGFTNASLDAPSVLALTSFDKTSSAPGATVGLLSPDANGNATQVLDTNVGGNFTAMQTSVITYTVSPNGRVALSGLTPAPVFYLFEPNNGFIVGTDAASTLGSLEPQTVGPFDNTTLSGTYTYGTEGTAVGSRRTDVGSLAFDGTQNVQGTEDDSSPGGLLANNPLSNAQYLFPSPSTAPSGRGTLDTSNNVNPSVAYIISPNKLIYINPPATSPRLVIVEK